MWKPYLTVVAKKAGHALHILDRFHIAMHMSTAIDEVRRSEVRDLQRQGRQPWLTKARWILLKRHEHRTATERLRLRELVRRSSVVTRKSSPPTTWRPASPLWTHRDAARAVRSRPNQRKNPSRVLMRRSWPIQSNRLRPSSICYTSVRYRWPRCHWISSIPIAAMPVRSTCARPQATAMSAGSWCAVAAGTVER